MSIATTIRIAAGILGFTFAGQAVEAQRGTALRVPGAVLERYVGDWVYPDGAVWNVTRLGDTLFHETPGQRFAYVPLSETLFRVGPVITAEFVTDEAGRAMQILSDGVGLEYRLRRKGTPPIPVATSNSTAPPVRVRKSVLERYVGVYEFIPGQMDRSDLRVEIRMDGGKLIREGAGPRSVLVPMSDTRFRVGNTSFVVEFVVDEAGVTQIMGTGFQQLLTRRTSSR